MNFKKLKSSVLYLDGDTNTVFDETNCGTGEQVGLILVNYCNVETNKKGNIRLWNEPIWAIINNYWRKILFYEWEHTSLVRSITAVLSYSRFLKQWDSSVWRQKNYVHYKNKQAYNPNIFLFLLTICCHRLFVLVFLKIICISEYIQHFNGFFVVLCYMMLCQTDTDKLSESGHVCVPIITCVAEKISWPIAVPKLFRD